MENKKMINVAQIGVGYWGPNLLRNKVANRNFKVNPVVDLALERRNFVKSLYPSMAVAEALSLNARSRLFVGDFTC